jgi:hypothetical protein
VSQARSQALIRVSTTAAGGVGTWTVPQAVTVLVKSLYAASDNAAAATVSMLVRKADGGPDIRLTEVAVPSGGNASWEGWFAIHPGDVLYLVVSEATIGVYVSGAVLAGAPLYPPADATLLGGLAELPVSLPATT